VVPNEQTRRFLRALKILIAALERLHDVIGRVTLDVKASVCAMCLVSVTVKSARPRAYGCELFLDRCIVSGRSLYGRGTVRSVANEPTGRC
jgi:hypothetical protein